MKQPQEHLQVLLPSVSFFEMPHKVLRFVSAPPTTLKNCFGGFNAHWQQPILGCCDYKQSWVLTQWCAGEIPACPLELDLGVPTACRIESAIELHQNKIKNTHTHTHTHTTDEGALGPCVLIHQALQQVLLPISWCAPPGLASKDIDSTRILSPSPSSSSSFGTQFLVANNTHGDHRVGSMLSPKRLSLEKPWKNMIMVMVMVRTIPQTWILMELMYWIDLQSHVPQAKRLIREEFKNDRLQFRTCQQESLFLTPYGSSCVFVHFLRLENGVRRKYEVEDCPSTGSASAHFCLIN